MSDMKRRIKSIMVVAPGTWWSFQEDQTLEPHAAWEFKATDGEDYEYSYNPLENIFYLYSNGRLWFKFMGLFTAVIEYANAGPDLEEVRQDE